MAGPRHASAQADARVAAAKARLLRLAQDVRPGYHAAFQAASLVRERPWRGVGLALLAGVVIGLAPREVFRRLVPLATPAFGMLVGVGARARHDVEGRAAPQAVAGVRRTR